MAAAFNLTAQLNLRGPNNVRNIVADIRRQLGTITGDVNLRIDPATTQNVTRLNGALTTLNNNLRVTQTNATNAANAMRQFTASISNIGNSTNNLNRNLNNAAVAAQRVGQQAQGTGRQVAVAATAMEEFGRQSQLAVKRFIAFSTGTAGVVGLVTAVRKGIDAFIEFDKQFVKLQQVTGESSVGLSKLANTISSLSTGLGVSSSELTEVSSTLAQAGFSARDTERALKALALSSLAPSFDNMNQTVEGSIALMRQFDISAADLEKSLGAVNAVAAKFAVESSDIIAAIQRTGGVFASASRGVSEGTDALNEFIAVFTSVRATTRESAETIATGLRTIFTRIQRGGTVEALKEFGVNLTDAEGKFVGAYKAVQLLSKGLNNIDPRDLKFSQIVEELGGFRQIGKVIPLIQQFATAQEALKVAQAGQASLAEDAAIAQLSLANQAAKVREEFLALFREIGGSDTFQTMAKGALSLASALISVADSVKGVLPVLAIMTAFRGASALRQFGTGFAGGFRSSGGMQGLGNRLGGGRQTNAKGGFIKRYRSGGDVEQVPVALMPGEAVIFPEDAARIGSSTLKRMNYADKRQKRAKGGKIGMVPGQGNSDSFYTTLPVGSFVIRKAATEAMGPDFIGDVAKGRQKFASGGIAALSTLSPGVGQSKIQSYIDDNTEVKKRKSKLQSKDIVSSNIQRKQLTKKDIGNIDLFRKSINTRTTTIGSRRGGTRFSNQGIAFENWIWDNIPSIQKSYRRARSKTYPLDLIPKSKSIPPAEIKFTTEQVPDPFILNKRLRYNLLNSDFSGFTKNIDKNAKVRPYTTIVYELAPGLKDEIYYGKDGPSKSTLLSRKERKDQQSTRLEKLGFSQNRYGGYIQKLMAGTFVRTAKGKNASMLTSTLQANKPKKDSFDEYDSTVGKILGISGVDKLLSKIEKAYGVTSARLIGSGGENVAFDIGDKVLKISRTGSGIQQIAKEIGLKKKDVAKIGNYQLPKGLEHVAGYTKVKTFGKLTAALQDKVKTDDSSKGMRDAELLQGKLAAKGLHWIDTHGSNMGYDKKGKPVIIDGMVLSKKYMDKHMSKDSVEDIESDGFGPTWEWERDIKKRKGKPRFNFGGYVQKLMAGTFVKSTAGRKKKQILADITKEDAERLPSSTIIGELSAPTIQAMLKESGVPLSANDLMRKRNLSAQEAAARDKVIGAYVTKINNKARDNRDQNIADTKAASRAGLLFGAVGMFGAPFPAENIQITKGLKKPTDIRVFGAVLDRNKAAREARLQKREEKLQKINTKRVAKGKSELKDIYSLDIMGAPIASDKSREYTKEEISGIKNRRNQSIIKEAEAALKLGLTGFFDFDDTSVIGRTAFPAGYQEEKPMKGQPAKSPDYTLFGNMNAVGEGLGKAKPTPLMKRLVRMLRKAKKRDTNLYNSLLSRINILSARPDDTMKQVVGPWLKSQGLDLPGANVMGVGSMGMSAKGVAAAKTSSMLQKAGASNSFIVDDSAINTGDARAAGIRAYTYSAKVDLDRATRKSLADMEGAKFENDLKAVLQDRAPLLYQAMSQQSETHRSVDFPYGLGPNIARGWFNNSLLASIPVDAKRTLSGPRGVILKNITNYLKTKGYASGGEIPSLDLSRSSKDKRLDPKKLASFLGQKSSTTDQQKKLAELLKDTSVSAPSKVNYEELLKGYAKGGEVPIVAQEGEYVINRKSAQSIGYHNLAKLNKYHSGGKVQKLRFGGMSENRTSLTTAEQENLKNAIRARTGVAGAFPAIPDPYTAAQQARIERQATAKGVAIPSAPVRSYDTGPGISSAPRSLSSNRVQKSTNDAIRAIDEAAKYGVDFAKEIRDTFEQTKKKITAQMARTQNAGKDPVKLAAIEQVADRNARIEATKKGISLGAFPQQIMGRRNLDDYSGMLNYSLRQKPVAPPPPPPPPKTIWTTLNSAVKTISDSLSTVGKKINTFGSNVDASGVSRDATGRRKRGFGKTGGGGFMSSNAAMGLSFAIPMAADLFAGGEAKSESAASSNALTQGIATSAGSSLMLGSMIGDMTQGATGLMKFAGPAAMAATAAIGVAKAFADAENAAREFAITSATDKLETNIERASKSFDSFQKDLKNINLQEIVKRDIVRTISAADELQSAKGRTQRGLANFVDTGAGSAERSQILFEKGIGDYISSIFGGSQIQSDIFATLIPKKANQAAKDYGGAAQLSSQFLEQRIRSGSDINSMMGSADFNQFARSLALADSAVQEHIMSINNLTGIDQEEKNKRIANVIAINGENKARKLETDVLKQMKLEEFDRSTNQLQNSLERMFQNMEQAIGKNVFELDKLSEQANLSAAALSGQAKAGSVRLKSINVLQNPRAYSSNERNAEITKAGNMFGAESSTVSGLLQASGRLEDTIMSTINQTIKEDPKAGNEKIGIRITSSISKVLEGLKLPPDVSAKLGESVNAAIGKIRTKGDEKIDFGDLMEKIPQLGKVMDTTRRAQEAAVKALEHWQGALNDYGNSMNQIVDLQVEANARLRRASDIGARGQMELDKVLGKEISLRTQMSVALAGVKSQTGGATNPVDISQNIRNLENRRSSLESMSNTAAQRGYSGKDEFMLMQDRLRNTNIALRENYDALKSMADNTEMASIAMSKINEIQQKRQAGVNIAERLVTSSPEELSSLNRAMDRLNNNMAGNINMGSTSDQRKESLDAFNMIAPFLGEQQNAMKANVLESMLLESGVGTNGMMGEVIQSLRNPEGDPQMQEAINEYKKAVELQRSANMELGRLNKLMTQNTADIAAQKLTSAMKGVQFDFQSTQLSDIDNSIKNLIKVVEGKPAAMAPGKAMGGLIYAAAGQLVNFQSKGTDTVPAMLTPGEFVVNRAATQKNLPLLNKINSGGYSTGGKVRYYADGGFVATDPTWQNLDEDKTKEEYDKSNIKYASTKEKYAPINTTNIDDNIKTLYTLPGKFYASPDSSEDLLFAKWEYPYEKPLTFSSSNIENPRVQFGQGYHEATINSYKTIWGQQSGFPSTSFSFSPDSIDTLKKPIGKFLDPYKIQNIYDTTKMDYVYTKASKDLYIRQYSDFIKKLSDTTVTGDTVSSKSGGTKINLKLPAHIPEVSPKINITDKQIKISDLAGEDGNNYLVFTDYDIARIKDTPASASDSHPIGFSHTVDSFFGDPGVLKISAGFDRIRQDFGSSINNKIKNYKPSKENIGIESVMKTSSFREELENKIKELQKDNIDTETSESIGRKKYISSFTNLWNGTVFSDSFDENYKGFDLKKVGITPPLTLYNQSVSEDWSKYVGKINKLATEKTNLKYSKLSTDFIEMKNLADNNKKKFAWTDGNFDEEDFKNIFGGVATSSQFTKKNVIVKEENYDKNGLKFSYKTYDFDSRLYDTAARRYTDTLANMGIPKIGVIPSQGSSVQPNDPNKAVNPFLGIADNILIPDGNPDTIINQLRNQKMTGVSTMDLFPVSYVDKTAGVGIEEFTLPGQRVGAGYTVPKIAKAFDFAEFFAAVDKAKSARATQTSINNAKKDMSATKIIKLTDAKRVSVARTVADYISKSQDPNLVSPVVKKVLDGRKIESTNHIRDAAIAIKSIVPGNAREDSLAYNKIDAWRALFSEIYKGAGDNNAATLQQLGANMDDKRFGGPVTEDYLGGKIVKYYKNYDGLPNNLIQSIIDREIAIKTAQQTSTEYKTQAGVDDKEQESFAFGSKGQGKVETIIPDNWNNLRELALDPQRIFPDTEVRKKYLMKLAQFYHKGTGADGVSPMIPDDRIRLEKVQRILGLMAYFFQFDKLVNTGLKTEELPTAGVIKPWGTDPSQTYQSFNQSLAAITDPTGSRLWDRFSDFYSGSLKLESGSSGKPPVGTLNAQSVADIIRASADLKKSEEKRQKDEIEMKNPGSVAGFATGGMVYANRGTLVNYQPRGTDTVPAMLTPGEFVINRESTSKYLPVLRAINSGSYSHGDLVKHFNNGGIVTPRYYSNASYDRIPGSLQKDPFDLSKSMGDLANKIISSITNGFEQAAARTINQPLQQTQTLNGVSSSDAGSLKTIDEFTNRLRSIADTLAGLGSIPKEINVTSTHTHNVIINGDAALNKLSPDLQKIVWKSISIAFDELEQANQIPGAPIENPFKNGSRQT